MLLNRPALALACALPLALSACGLRYDESYPAERQSRAAVQRVEHAAAPPIHPSPREQRQARAAIQELERVHRKMRAAGADAIVTAAGASTNAASVKFAAERNALHLEIAASDRLNLIDGVPHALTLVVYHLADRLAFDHLAASENGIRRLLEAEPFDDRSVRGVKRLDIQPGMAGVVALDRPDDGRHVAVVAGYNRPHPYASVGASAYPVGQFDKKVRTLVVTGRVAMFAPLPLDLRVELDETEMRIFPTDILVNDFVDSRKMSFAETQRYIGVYH